MKIKVLIAKSGFGILFLVVSYSLIFLLSWKIYKEPEYQENKTFGESIIVQLPFENILSAAWNDDKNLILLQKRIDKDGLISLWQIDFNVKTREPKEWKVIEGFDSGIFGIDSTQNLMICLWENKIRNKPEEFGTTINLVSLAPNFEEIYKFEVLETVKLDHCDNSILIMSEGNTVLEKFSKTYDIKNKNYLEAVTPSENMYDLSISGTNTTKVIQAQIMLLEMQIPNKFWFVIKDNSSKSFAFIDYNNKVLMYLNQ